MENPTQVYEKAKTESQRIGEKVRKWRIAANWKQSELASRMNSEPCVVSLLENGHCTNITIITMFKICEAFQIGIQDLFN